MADSRAEATSVSGGNNGDTISGGGSLWPIAIIVGIVALVWLLATGKRGKRG